MLRMTVCTNAKGAIDYFDHSLSIGDYYVKGQECVGLWHGKGAWTLGLKNLESPAEVTRKQFSALAMNTHPTKGGPLTERTTGNRRIGYDINFHPPKSVTLVNEIARDQAMEYAVRSTVREIMEQMEADMKCRVRVGGAEHDRNVGNLCWAEFIHFTARPVDGIPDPHLHAHCFTFNAVWDGVEQKWKAGQFGDLKRDAPFYEACFHSRLAEKIVAAGYTIERRGKSWEISHVPDEAIRICSRRTSEIEAKAKELGITDAEAKSKLGAKTRKHKQLDIPIDELRQTWRERLGPKLVAAIEKGSKVGRGGIGFGIEKSAEKAIDYAVGVSFERQSVISDKELLTAAMRRSVGAVSLGELQQLLETDARFIRKESDGVKRITTKEIMAEEERMIAFARDGRGTQNAIAPDHVIKDQRLNEQQRAAVMHTLQSNDRVVMIQGGAGTGKTTLMTEAINAMNGSWLKRQVVGDIATVLAPSADASRGVLRDEGFKNADTLAKFLVSKKMQDAASGGVLWIDEAGLVGSRTMAKVCEIAEKIGARIILSGDPAQHRAVERGDPLRLFRDYAGVEPSYVTEIQRQRGLYKSAVEHLNRGEIAQGFDGLKKLGCFHEAKEEIAHKQIAYDYVTSIQKKQSSLIVSPTHAECRKITQAVRTELEERKEIRGKARKYDRFEDLRWTQAEKEQRDLYQKGMVVQFHQNVPGFTAGKHYSVIGRIPGGGVLVSGAKLLPCERAKQFNVYQHHKKDTELKRGDMVRITANGKSVHAPSRPLSRPHALNNGSTYKVAGFTPRGHIRLTNGWVIDKNYGHLTHAYCTTSHSSQGKTVDRIFLAESASSFGAASAEQFLVSVSRARKECIIYTDDLDGLRRNVEKHLMRPMAVELSDKHESERLEELAKKAAQERARGRSREFEKEKHQRVNREQEFAHG